VLTMLVFTIHQQSVRKEMNKKLQYEQLQTIVLAENEIKWVKAGEEIIIDGKMFDIKSFEIFNGKIVFHGLFDKEETTLQQQLVNSWEKNQTNKNLLLGQLFETLEGFYFHSVQNTILLSNCSVQFSPFSDITLLNQFEEIPTPPPLS
nr:hypothetical protein [Chitinophagaceae bacterium]